MLLKGSWNNFNKNMAREVSSLKLRFLLGAGAKQRSDAVRRCTTSTGSVSSCALDSFPVIVLSQIEFIVMLRATKYRIYPTDEQRVHFVQSFGCCRFAWNFALNLTNETYKATGKGLSRFAIQKEITNLKKEYEWMTEPYSQCLQVVALNLSRAFINFFEGRASKPASK
jgi:hypothetical protein